MAMRFMARKGIGLRRKIKIRVLRRPTGGTLADK
jgi:hypothetical protein